MNRIPSPTSLKQLSVILVQEWDEWHEIISIMSFSRDVRVVKDGTASERKLPGRPCGK